MNHVCRNGVLAAMRSLLMTVGVASFILAFGAAEAADLDMWVSIYRGQTNVYYCINPVH